MNKSKLIRRVVEVLKDNGTGKTVSFPKYSFHIEDDEGNRKDFHVRKSEKKMSFSVEDVTAILDAAIEVAEECIKQGEPLSIHGFGRFGLRLRQRRATKIPNTDQWVEIDAHYGPVFVAGEPLRLCAKIYELSLAEKLNGVELPVFDDESDGDEDVD